VADIVLAYSTTNAYFEVEPDLSAASSSTTLPAGMAPTFFGRSDGAHAYSVHGTTLGRIDPDGNVDSLTIPTARRFTLTDDYVWCVSTSSSGTLVKVAKDTFNSYSTYAINAGSGGSYNQIQDYVATDGDGNIWVAAAQASPARVRLVKFDPVAETWSTPYTLSQALGRTIGYTTLQIDESTAFLGMTDSFGNGRLLKVDLTTGTVSNNIAAPSNELIDDLVLLGSSVYVNYSATGVPKITKLAQSDLSTTATVQVNTSGSFQNITTDGDQAIYTAGGTVLQDRVVLIDATSMTVSTFRVFATASTRYCTYFQVTPPTPGAAGWVVGSVGW
jgi:hypothetical protein